MGNLVTVRQPDLPYVLLSPLDNPVGPTSDITICDITDVGQWSEWLRRAEGVVAVDIETRGTDPVRDDTLIVGIGFAVGGSALYIDVSNITRYQLDILVPLIEGLQGCIGHNIYFDWSFLRYHWECEPNWVACTYGLYRQLATEGFFQQRWGLKSAQKDLLRWENTNEEDLDLWLVDNGYIKNIKKPVDGDGDIPPSGYYPIQNDRGELRYAAPDKGEMWRAPRDILGYYCALDCDSTSQLYELVLRPQLGRFPDLDKYHTREYLTLVDILVTQKLVGIRVNTVGLQEHAEYLVSKIASIRTELANHPLSAPYIREWEQQRIDEFHSKQPSKFLKGKPIPQEPHKYCKEKGPGTEPKKITKSGSISKSWEKWNERRIASTESGGKINLNWIRWNDRIRSGHYDLVVSKNWESWDERRKLIEQGMDSKYLFNVASRDQLEWLLYHKLFDYSILREPTDRRRGILELYVDGRSIELDMTDSGSLPTDGKALSQMGEVGDILRRYSDNTKELSYIRSYLELAIPIEGEPGFATLHPNFRVPGTLTGRLSSSGPNCQQIPGVRSVLDCFVARPGYVFVQQDVNALENVVLAELSEDPALMEIYGPGAAPHDSYLFNASRMYEVAGVEIFKEIASKYVPNVDVIADLKKEFKGIRGISKKTTLSKNYGIGSEKLYKDLLLQGASVTREDVDAIHRAYDDVYAGVKEWGDTLAEEWRVRGGWVYNGIGRPIGVCEQKKKDLVNSVCQSTGHDCLMTMVYHSVELLNKYVPDWNPIIMSLHDETIIEVPEEYAEIALDILENKIYNLTNAELGGIIPLAGEGEIGKCLSDVKKPER